MKNFLKTNGFSLLELLVALVILSLSLVALAGLMTTTTKNNAFGNYITEATTMAQDKLEEIRALPWNNISGYSDMKEGSTGIKYKRSWEVRDLNPNLKEVEVTIQWRDSSFHSLKFLYVVSNSEV